MGKQHRGHLPQLKSQAPRLQPLFAERCSNWYPAGGQRHPSQETGTQLGLHSGLLPSHNGLPFHSQCPQVCTWITGNIIQFTSFELWLHHGPRKNSKTEKAVKSCLFPGNGTGVIWIPYTNPKWLVGLTWKLAKCLIVSLNWDQGEDKLAPQSQWDFHCWLRWVSVWLQIKREASSVNQMILYRIWSNTERIWKGKQKFSSWWTFSFKWQ